ncbi:hypothetical protein ACJ73_04911 [Blastomyces percursus]|uniref:Uncharacterized protein n=1 Tax=Blastomyces percursus TaxID=1658174 RepID=A0A1J9R5G4_9EURO|nr:hypothetical protein ACJ73_04911 [Blastomyces percursus]
METSRITTPAVTIEYAECHCRCGYHKTPEHFYHCRLARRAMGSAPPPSLQSPRDACDTPGGTEIPQLASQNSFLQGHLPDV